MLRSFLPYSFIAFSHSVSRLKCAYALRLRMTTVTAAQARTAVSTHSTALPASPVEGVPDSAESVCGGRRSRRRGCIRRGRIRRRARIVAERRNFHRVPLIPADRAFLVLRARLGRRRFFVYLPLEGVFSLIGFRTAVRTCMPVLLRAGRPFLRIIMLELLHFQLIGCFLYAVNKVLVADRTMLVRLDALRRTGWPPSRRRRTAYAVRG